MSKITASTDIQQVPADEVQKWVDLFCQDVVRVVNNGMDFASNFNCKVVSFSFTAANTDTAVVHNLGREASTFLVLSKSAACDIYNGSDPTANILYLKGTALADVTVVVM